MTYAQPQAFNVLGSLDPQALATLDTLYRVCIVSAQGLSLAAYYTYRAIQFAKPYAKFTARAVWATRHFVLPCLMLVFTFAVMGAYACHWAIEQLLKGEVPPQPTPEWDPWEEPTPYVPPRVTHTVNPKPVLLLAPSRESQACAALQGLTVAELRKVGQTMGIPKARNMRRADLLAALSPV